MTTYAAGANESRVRHKEMTMKPYVVVLFIAALATACGGGGDSLVGKAEAIAKKMCACKDAKCADDVSKELREMRKSNKGKDKDKEPSKADVEKLMKARQQYRKCEKELMEKAGADHPAVKKMAGFADEMCKCADKACGDKVMKQMREMRGGARGLRKHTREHTKRLGECYAKLK